MNIITDIDSGTSRTLNFIQEKMDGSIFDINDLKVEGVTYTNKRTILVKFCEAGIIKRVCRGIYFYSSEELDIPSMDIILDKLALSDGFKYCPSGSYAEYIMGIIQIIPHNCICYTNGKIKRVSFNNGVNVLFLPSKKTNYSFKSKEIMIATNYLLSLKEERISSRIINKIKLYLEKVSIYDIEKDYYLIPNKILKYFPFNI